MATWNLNTFSERGQRNGTFNPQHPTSVNTVIRHVPGGSSFVYTTTTAIKQEWELPIQCEGAIIQFLRSDIGETDQLDYSAGTLTNVTLKEVRDVVEIVPGTDLYQATLVFII